MVWHIVKTERSSAEHNEMASTQHGRPRPSRTHDRPTAHVSTVKCICLSIMNLDNLLLQMNSTSKIRHTRTMNELQMSSYARQYYVLGVETRDHVTANYQTHDGQARDDANNATGYTPF